VIMNVRDNLSGGTFKISRLKNRKEKRKNNKIIKKNLLTREKLPRYPRGNMWKSTMLPLG
jgi:hypothetical protein